MYDLLSGLRLVEISAFIAAPFAGLTLSQLGADVIRIDPEGGGIDYSRWPLSEDGMSLYWAGLNKGKRSAALDLRSEEGQETVRQILKNSGPEGGILLTNLSGPNWMGYEALSQVRPDLILVSLTGHNDGSPAVDYTVNSAVGVPLATGDATPEAPINAMMPVWDVAAGLTLATAILAADRERQKTGRGREIRLALSDVAYGVISALGMMTEAEVLDRDRPALGNHIFGTFGHNLPSRDGRQVMVAAFTRRQWHALVTTADCSAQMQELATRHGLNLDEEGNRYALRDEILTVLTDWSQRHDFTELCDRLERGRVLWGPYRSFRQMLAEDPRASTQNPIFNVVDQPGVGSHLSAGSPLNLVADKRQPVRPAPAVGDDTQTILREFDSDRTDD